MQNTNYRLFEEKRTVKEKLATFIYEYFVIGVIEFSINGQHFCNDCRILIRYEIKDFYRLQVK